MRNLFDLLSAVSEVVKEESLVAPNQTVLSPGRTSTEDLHPDAHERRVACGSRDDGVHENAISSSSQGGHSEGGDIQHPRLL